MSTPTLAPDLSALLLLLTNSPTGEDARKQTMTVLRQTNTRGLCLHEVVLEALVDALQLLKNEGEERSDELVVLQAWAETLTAILRVERVRGRMPELNLVYGNTTIYAAASGAVELGFEIRKLTSGALGLYHQGLVVAFALIEQAVVITTDSLVQDMVQTVGAVCREASDRRPIQRTTLEHLALENHPYPMCLRL